MIQEQKIYEPVKDISTKEKDRYYADIKVMNNILQVIPNDIYNSVDACEDAQGTWQHIKRLMQGTDLSAQERHSRLMNEFDMFSVEIGESLTSVYERFSTLMNNMDRKKIKPNEISLNTKFLNSLQPEWGKYVTMALLSHTLSKEYFDKLYDNLSQCEPLVNASRAKKDAMIHWLYRNAGRTTGNQATNARNGFAQNTVENKENDKMIPRTTSTPRKTNFKCYNYNGKEENDFMLMNAYGDDQLEELNALVIMKARIRLTDNKSDAEPTYNAKVINEINAFQVDLTNELLSKGDHELLG
nr:hypothetical protein [Tanacetum cinerariifolium]